MFRSVGFYVISFVLLSCDGPQDPINDEVNDDRLNHSFQKEIPAFCFAAAGHVYGSATDYTGGIHPPFMIKFREVQKELDEQSIKIDRLILTGDVIAHSTESGWDSTYNQLDSLLVPWYVAPGNHDLTGGYLNKFQGNNFNGWKLDEHRLFYLNTTRPGWTIDEEQVSFINENLEGLGDSGKVFVLTHQLWWQRNPPEKMELDSVRPNSYAAFDGPSSFWEDAFAIFDSLENECYFIAGDLGSDAKIESYYEDHFENYHFYASGMGSKKADNFLMIYIYEDGTVEIERIDF